MEKRDGAKRFEFANLGWKVWLSAAKARRAWASLFI